MDAPRLPDPSAGPKICLTVAGRTCTLRVETTSPEAANLPAKTPVPIKPVAPAGLPRTLVLGLAGGVGSGKSLVAELLAKRGAGVVDADAIGHRVLGRPQIRARLARAWGPGILRGEKVDRGALARAAFRSRGSVERLNRIVHPAILRDIRKRLAASRRWMVLDAALLFESGADRLCDRVIFVGAPRSLRTRRVAARGWPPGELRRRERFQGSLAYKKKKADYVLDNTGSKSRTEQQIEKILDDLRRTF